VAPIDEELARALREVPSKPDIVAIAALLAAEDARADPKATSELNWKFCNGLRKATHIVLSAAEFHSVADAILRAQLFDVLSEFAVAGKRREPNERFWRFYEIAARTRNDPERMSVTEEEAIDEICESPAIVADRLGRSRIERYLDGSGDDPGSKQRARRREDSEASRDLDFMEGVLEDFLESLPPQEVMRLIRSRGRDGAVAAIADRLGKLPNAAEAPRVILETMAKMLVAAAAGDDFSPF
jgi:hypothetical protein